MARKPIKLTPEELGQTASQRVKKTLGSGTRTATSFIKDFIPQKAKDTVRSGLEKGKTTGNKILNKVYTPEAQARNENVKRMAQSVGQKPGNTVGNQAQLEAQKRIAQGEKVLKDTTEATKRATSTARQNIGGPASRANEKIRVRQNTVGPDRPTGSNTGTTSNRVNRPTSAPEPPRVKGSPLKNAFRTGGRFASRALPPLAVGATALEAGVAGGKHLMDTEGGRNLLRQASGPLDEALGLTGGADVSGVTGQDTLSNLDNPDQVVPRGTSGGFFSTDERSLNPGRSVEELDAGSGPTPVGLRDLLTGNVNAPVEPEQTEQTTAPTAPEDAAPAETGGKRRTLREALAGFKRSNNPLADAMKLNARLGLADSHNQSLRKTQEFDETKRQNDFTNAMDLHAARIDEMAAAGDISQAEADGRKAENQVTKDAYDRIDKSNLSDSKKEQAKTDFTFTQSRNTGHDTESLATQTMFTRVLQEIRGEEGGAISKIIGGIVPNFLGGASGSSSFTDAFDGKAPLMDAETIDMFAIDNDGNLTADKGDGVQSFVLSLEDISDTSAQFLQEVLGKRKALR